MLEREKAAVANKIEEETLRSGKGEIEMKNAMARLMRKMPIPELDEHTRGEMDCRRLLEVYDALLLRGAPLMSLHAGAARPEYLSEKAWKTDRILESKRRVLESQAEEIRDIKSQIFRLNSQIVHSKTKELLGPEKKARGGELSFCKGGGLSLRSREPTARTEEGGADADAKTRGGSAGEGGEPFPEGGFDMKRLKNNVSFYAEPEPEDEDEGDEEAKRQMKEDLNVILEMNSIIYSTIQSIDRLERISSKEELLHLQKKNELLIKALRAKKLN